MKNTNTQSIPNFINKLLMMIQKYPKTVGWDQEGICIVFYNQEHLANQVLPHFFRHSNMGSFTRQLNIYGFSKSLLNKQVLSFHHQLFHKNNSEKYHLIIRKKKEKALIKEDILNKELDLEEIIHEKYSNSTISNMPYIINSLFLYKNKIDKDLKKIKKNTEDLNRQMNVRQHQKVKMNITFLKETMKNSIQNFKKVQDQIKKINLNQIFEDKKQSKSIIQFVQQQISEQQNLIFSKKISNEIETQNLKSSAQSHQMQEIKQFPSISKFFSIN